MAQYYLGILAISLRVSNETSKRLRSQPSFRVSDPALIFIQTRLQTSDS